MGRYMWRKYIRVVAGLIPLARRARGHFWIQCCRATAGTIGHGSPAGIRAQLFPTNTFQSVFADARLRLA